MRVFWPGARRRPNHRIHRGGGMGAKAFLRTADGRRPNARAHTHTVHKIPPACPGRIARLNPDAVHLVHDERSWAAVRSQRACACVIRLQGAASMQQRTRRWWCCCDDVDVAHLKSTIITETTTTTTSSGSSGGISSSARKSSRHHFRQAAKHGVRAEEPPVYD